MSPISTRHRMIGYANFDITLTLTAQPMIKTERLRTRIKDALAGLSSTFDTVYQCSTNHNTTGLCVTFGRAVDSKSRHLKPTSQSNTEHRKHERDNGCLGGVQGMAWFGFWLLSSVFCFLSSVFCLLSSVFCLLSSVCFLSVCQWLSVWQMW